MNKNIDSRAQVDGRLQQNHRVTSLDLHSLARALGGKVSNGQVLAPGPGHSADDQSLSVKIDPAAPDGFVVHSFAGEDAIALKDYVRSKAGLPAFKPNGSRHRHASANNIAVSAVESEPTKDRILESYSYTDASGTLLYEVLRYEPKTFRQRRPDGKGGREWKQGERRVLYRWPELRKFPDGTVFVCEGEKDANRVASLGYCATTVANGNWDGVDVTDVAGRDVLILEDNDDAGRKKALAAAQALHGTAKTIRIVRLPGLPNKGDVSDWLNADPRNAGKLVNTCFDAPLWTPTEKLKGELRTAAASDIKMQGIDWLWPGRFARGKFGLIAGLPDYGKGQIAAFIAAAVTAGIALPCGEGNATQGNVIWFNAEDGMHDTVVPRLAAAGADLKRVTFVNGASVDGKDKTFNLVTDLPLLRETIQEIGNVALVIIDPVSAYLGVGKVEVAQQPMCAASSRRSRTWPKSFMSR
jgi:hypothetical protein